MTRSKDILAALELLADPEIAEGMARFGITGASMLGVSMKSIRSIAKETGKNHRIASELWRSGIHEARILASLVEEPECVTERQMDAWVNTFNSWDLCDQCCLNLFDKTPIAYRKAVEWTGRKEEFVKRAGFALMAVLAVHDKTAADNRFLPFLECIRRQAGDERNFVRKAVNWALRQIGKRNESLNRHAVAEARRLSKHASPTARWIASDALRELTSEKTTAKLRRSAVKRTGPV